MEFFRCHYSPSIVSIDLTTLLFVIILPLIPLMIWLCRDLDRRWSDYRRLRVAGRALRQKI